MRGKIIVVAFCVLTMMGCSSTRSILIHRDECDVSWEKERWLNGVPITLQVPTHIKVDVVEHHFLGYSKAAPASPSGDAAGGSREVGWLNKDRVGVPIRSVQTNLIKTAKIFTVDPKRPAAGTLNSTLEFGGVNDQYLDKITYDVDDQTIQAVTGLLQNVAKQGLFGAPTSDAGGKSVDAEMRRIDSVVASAFFSLDAPDVELKIAHFLDAHLNGCHTCRIVESGVKSPERFNPPLEEPCPHGNAIQSCPSCVHY